MTQATNYRRMTTAQLITLGSRGDKEASRELSRRAVADLCN